MPTSHDLAVPGSKADPLQGTISVAIIASSASVRCMVNAGSCTDDVTLFGDANVASGTYEPYEP